ncbi:MAG: helix-turn-helix domain-containing protein [Oscillospiraceae bacterium]
MYDLSEIYRPAAAAPFGGKCSYYELYPQGALRPYVCCFWEAAPEHGCSEQNLVIPDTCMDIIFDFGEENEICGSGFCTLSEKPVILSCDEHYRIRSKFGIRLYAWTAALFADNSLAGTKNSCYEINEFFPDMDIELREKLSRTGSFSERVRAARSCLLKRIDAHRMNAELMNAIYDILTTSGTARISDIAANNAVSERQLERRFYEKLGTSPKAFSSLVRFQMLRRELTGGKACDIRDMIVKYNYFDQAHLIKDFRRYHGITPSQVAAAEENLSHFYNTEEKFHDII